MLMLAVLLAGGGAQCLPTRWQGTPAGPVAPRLLPDNPTLDQVIGVVNTNTQNVHTYWTNNARISVAGLPPLRADIALERPRRFRLRADTVLTGLEADLGSNDEQFWFWARRSQPPALYFCSHERFAVSPIRQILPVDPRWIVEALGLTTFDPSAQHAGPIRVHGDRLEVRSRLPSPAGELVKITVVDAARGWVIEQHLYTAQGERLASALGSGHRFNPVANVSLPAHIELQLPNAQLQLKIDTGDFQVNTLQGDPTQLWTRPVYPGNAEIDLGRPPAVPASTAQPAPAGMSGPQ